MKLIDKMFKRPTPPPPLRSIDREVSDREYFDSLFREQWEVFVIKRDDRSGQFRWFTLPSEDSQVSEYAT